MHKKGLDSLELVSWNFPWARDEEHRN